MFLCLFVNIFVLSAINRQSGVAVHGAPGNGAVCATPQSLFNSIIISYPRTSPSLVGRAGR